MEDALMVTDLIADWNYYNANGRCAKGPAGTAARGSTGQALVPVAGAGGDQRRWNFGAARHRIGEADRGLAQCAQCPFWIVQTFLNQFELFDQNMAFPCSKNSK
jgi:hypothetical protein